MPGPEESPADRADPRDRADRAGSRDPGGRPSTPTRPSPRPSAGPSADPSAHPSTANDPDQGALFDVPPGSRRPRCRVVVLTGPSGSGKTSLSTRTGIPSLSLDHFYRDGDEAGLPLLREGLVDWDDPASWDTEAALTALLDLCRTGRAEIPVYDIPTNRRTSTRTMVVDAPLLIAEGIFAAELVRRLEDEGVLADALCIARHPLRNMWFRLLRDLGEARKPAPVLVVRGAKLAHEEPGKVRHWIDQGCRPVHSLAEAAAALEALAAAEAHAREAARP